MHKFNNLTELENILSINSFNHKKMSHLNNNLAHHPLLRNSTPSSRRKTLGSSSSSHHRFGKLLPQLLLIFTALFLLIQFTPQHCREVVASSFNTAGGDENPSGVDFDPNDPHKTTFCTCQCCKDTMCNNIPNATFAVASCFECTKFVCDALGYECKTTLYRALCVQKNDIISQILMIIVFTWIFSMVIAAVVKAYLWPLVQKLIKRIRQTKHNTQ